MSEARVQPRERGPDFVGVGVQKSGTTWAADVLAQLLLRYVAAALLDQRAPCSPAHAVGLRRGHGGAETPNAPRITSGRFHARCNGPIRRRRASLGGACRALARRPLSLATSAEKPSVRAEGRPEGARRAYGGDHRDGRARSGD